MKRYSIVILAFVFSLFCNDLALGEDLNQKLLQETQNGNIEKVKELLEQGADVNVRGSGNSTPLIWAAYNKRHDIVKILLSFKANPNLKDNNDKTAMKYAEDNKADDIVNQLKIITSTDNDLSELLSSNTSTQNTTDNSKLNEQLRECCNSGDLECVKRLIKAGADIEYAPADYWNKEKEPTPLMLASAGGYKEICQVLLDNGADINKIYLGSGEACLRTNSTALGAAVEKGKLDIVKYLINRGADIETGNHPFIVACWFWRREICDYFLNKSKEYIYRTYEGRACIHEAIDYCNSPENQQSCKEFIQYLINKGADVNSKSYSKEPVIFHAVYYQLYDILQILVKNKANVNIQNEEGDTPLMYACANSYLQQKNIDMAQFLINNGANVNIKNHHGGSALTEASQGLTEFTNKLINILLKAGANKGDLLRQTNSEWWFCGNNSSCIDRMRITLENNTFSHITTATIMLTIKDASKRVLYKKKHTISINLDHGEQAPSSIFNLVGGVYGNDGCFDNGTASIDVEVLSVR